LPSLARELAFSPAVWIRWQALCNRLSAGHACDSRRMDWLATSCSMVRRSAALEVGPWDEGYRFEFDDADWCYRARELGWGVRLSGDAVAHQLAPYQMTEGVSREALLGFEHSLNRLIERFKSPRAASVHRAARRLRWRLTRLLALAASVLLLRRHRRVNARARAARWLLDWYRAGRPAVDAPPLIECETDDWLDLW